MHIECHKAKILHQWSANGGRMLNGAVLVEFTLHDGPVSDRRRSSKLVEYVSFQTDPRSSEQHRNLQLERRAFEQIMLYFDGAGKNENLFADGPETTQPKDESFDAEIRIIADLDATDIHDNHIIPGALAGDVSGNSKPQLLR